MCLYADEETARPAENDIVCYKVMRRVRCDNRCVLRSEYYGFDYRVGKSYLCHEFSEEADRSIARYDNYVVERGFHSYMKIDEALSHAKDAYYYDTLVIVKCMIPKGSLMFSAISDGEYCSERIKVIGWESLAVVRGALSERRADSIEWKGQYRKEKKPKDDTERGIHKIVKTFRSWMSK
jgi:hypothetical protein